MVTYDAAAALLCYIDVIYVVNFNSEALNITMQIILKDSQFSFYCIDIIDISYELEF